MNKPSKHEYPCHHNTRSEHYDEKRRASLSFNLVPRLPYFSSTDGRCAFCAYELGWADAMKAALKALREME